MGEDQKNEREQVRQLVRTALQQELGQTPAPPNGEAAAGPTVIDESVKDVITEIDIRDVPEGARLLIREDAILTPSARDLIAARRVEVRHRTRRRAAGKQRVIALGSDHGGFEAKERLKLLLEELGYRYRDFGTFSNEAVDYPDFAHSVARSVADGVCELGIVVDGAGIGSCMAANKVPGVRAAMCYDEATARNSREHNYANVLTLGGRLLPFDKVREIVKAWLDTPEGEERHGKRVAKIMTIERQYLR
ncbi:MAG TPA: RpiB/LacA/LacB family sugar-phosphate isomerase [Blastocatellia bacterium]|nr:RpiB/LacA/LacB family sugar-phosphate isomerase [Blastocatellia bacterium]